MDRLRDRQRFRIRELDRVVVAGRSDAVSVYELLDCDPTDIREAKLASAETFARALDMYRKGQFAAAIGLFADVAEKNPQDSAARLFVQRCAGVVQQAPAMDWNGVTVLDSK